jgi:hypothetical protein
VFPPCTDIDNSYYPMNCQNCPTVHPDEVGVTFPAHPLQEAAIPTDQLINLKTCHGEINYNGKFPVTFK